MEVEASVSDLHKKTLFGSQQKEVQFHECKVETLTRNWRKENVLFGGFDS